VDPILLDRFDLIRDALKAQRHIDTGGGLLVFGRREQTTAGFETNLAGDGAIVTLICTSLLFHSDNWEAYSTCSVARAQIRGP
jgi:hypothetical protein